MPMLTDKAHIAAVLEAHGVSLSEQELEMVHANVGLNAQMLRTLTETAAGIPAETPPALHPGWDSAAWNPVVQWAARSEASPTEPPRDTPTSKISEAAPPPDTASTPGFPRRFDSPSEAVESALARIEAHPDAAVYVAVFVEQARTDAKALESKAGAGGMGGPAPAGRDGLPLWGTTVSIKDLMRIKGYAMTGGTRALTWPAAAEDATIVARLRRAGAVVIGAANLHELAFGTTGANPHFGVCANPAAPGRYSGGSSSGSAASVGFGMATFSIGTDTGGSIRIPAAGCGVVGFKPSFGLLPTDGVFPLGYSLDHVGPLTKTVTEAAVLMDVLADRPGAFTANLERPLRGLRIGVPTNYFTVAEPDVLAAHESALERAQALGARLVPLALPLMDLAPVAYMGSSAVEAIALHYHTLVQNGHKLGTDVRTRLAANLLIPAYARVKAQQLRTLIFRELMEAFQRVDVIATPTLPMAPPPVGTAAVSVEDVTLSTTFAFLRNTCPFNLSGLPAISIPNGANEDGAPIGLQLVGPLGGDAQVLAAARSVERDVLGLL